MKPTKTVPSWATLGVAALVSVSGCTPADAEDSTTADDEGPAAMETSPEVPTRIVDLLRAGDAVFGIFSGDHTRGQGAVMAQNPELDFIFYSLESGPFDIPAMQAYMDGLAAAAGPDGVLPIALRIPPIGDDPEGARSRAAEGMAAGIGMIVFPHVKNAEEAALAVATTGSEGWPANPNGTVTNLLIIEDRESIPNAEAIVNTPGVGVVVPGPGDLRRSYEGDMEAVEGAIQEVLAHCLAANVPCGITAGVDDIGTRIEQGFRLIIVTQPEALAVGRAAAGRME